LHVQSFVFWQSEASIPTRTLPSQSFVHHVVALRCNKNFPCFILVLVSSSQQRTPDKIFHSTHESRVLLRFVYPPASEVIQVFNVDDVCLSFLRNRSGCNGIRTGVEEDSSDGSRVGGSCWGYRSAGPAPGKPFNAFGKRCSTGVASRVFGGTSGRQRRCILRLLRLIISRVFLPRDLIDSWDTYKFVKNVTGYFGMSVGCHLQVCIINTRIETKHSNDINF